MRLSTADLGLDQASYLPAVLTYELLPDKGADTPIGCEVRYAKYTSVGGVQLPFSIQRDQRRRRLKAQDNPAPAGSLRSAFVQNGHPGLVVLHENLVAAISLRPYALIRVVARFLP
jgi:hypothetical protein